LKSFVALARKKERLVVGLMSGTSADGIDAVLVRIRGSGPATKVETIEAMTSRYPDPVRRGILGLADANAAEIAAWNVDLGEAFADAALEVIAAAGLVPAQVDLVGSHGQTIAHLPGKATLQIGEPCVIAEITGLPVVADFRPRDVAPRAEDVVAFDTGPANAPIDAAVRIATKGRQGFDRDGRLARAGRIDESEVKRLLRHPWFRRPPPKSLDRDAFGARVAQDLHGRGLRGADLVATATEFVARTVADAYARHVAQDAAPIDVVVSGGGIHNQLLMDRLRALLAPLPVRSSAELGVDPDAKEAVAFAVLANEFVAGRPGNLPRATGARRAVVLGKFVPGKR
jgi:anhydro-N-acetylmuramic acid kinase